MGVIISAYRTEKMSDDLADGAGFQVGPTALRHRGQGRLCQEKFRVVC
jgi:hypothetical protein